MSITKKYFNFKYGIYKPNIHNVYAKTMINQFLGETELTNLQDKALTNLLRHIWKHNAHYHKKYSEHKLDYGHMEAKFIDKLPVLNRKEIMDHQEAIISNTAEKKFMRISTTAGTTGEPLKVYHDLSFPHEVALWRFYEWVGIKPWFHGGHINRQHFHTTRSRLKYALQWFPTKRYLLDASLMQYDTTLSFAKKLNKLTSYFLGGYVGGVNEFASTVAETDIITNHPIAIYVTAAPLTNSVRNNIEEKLQSSVYDFYGSNEVLYQAAECKKKSGLHVFSDILKFEILDDNGDPCEKEEMGYVHITDLTNYSFPLVRYSTRDKTRWLDQACECGINLPLVDNIRGRVSDSYHFGDQLTIPGEYLTSVFDDYPNSILKYQFVKDNSGVTLNVIKNQNYSKSDKEIGTVFNMLRKKYEKYFDLRLKYVEKIDHDGGKDRYVVDRSTP